MFATPFTLNALPVAACVTFPGTVAVPSVVFTTAVTVESFDGIAAALFGVSVAPLVVLVIAVVLLNAPLVTRTRKFPFASFPRKIPAADVVVPLLVCVCTSRSFTENVPLDVHPRAVLAVSVSVDGAVSTFPNESSICTLIGPSDPDGRGAAVSGGNVAITFSFFAGPGLIVIALVGRLDCFPLTAFSENTPARVSVTLLKVATPCTAVTVASVDPAPDPAATTSEIVE